MLSMHALHFFYSSCAALHFLLEFVNCVVVRAADTSPTVAAASVSTAPAVALILLAELLMQQLLHLHVSVLAEHIVY